MANSKLNKDTEPVALTAGEMNDISMGVGQRLLDEDTQIGEVLICILDIDPKVLQTYRKAGTKVGTATLLDKD